MESLIVILETLFIVFTIILIVVSCIEKEPAGFILAIITGLTAFALISSTIKKSSDIHIYKVRELEKNTVFNITDSIGGFKPKDSVWVNYNKLMIDPLDSVAMQCIIIEEIK